MQDMRNPVSLYFFYCT